MFKKYVAPILFGLVFTLALIMTVFTAYVLNAWLMNKMALTWLELDSASWFLRISGTVVGICVMICWLAKWPWPVNWFSLALGASGFGLAAMAQFVSNQYVWNEPSILPWRIIWTVLIAVSCLCLGNWVFDPRYQQTKQELAKPKK